LQAAANSASIIIKAASVPAAEMVEAGVVATVPANEVVATVPANEVVATE